MKFTLSSAALLALASFASASVLPRSCPEASRFGNPVVSSPTNATSYNGGDPVTIKVDFSCAINNFGIVPQFIDYTIQVPENLNNGFEPPLVLARGRTLAPGSTTDEFTTTIPHWNYFANAAYNVFVTDTYYTEGSDGSQVLTEGDVYVPITINPPSSS